MKKTTVVVLALGLGSPQMNAHAHEYTPRSLPAAVIVSAPPAPEAPNDEEAELLGFALRDRVSIARDRSGQGTVPAAHCRKASEGCDLRMQVFAGYLVDAARARVIDPFLLGAMAVRESMLDPFAVGGVGELGILQINPSRPDAKQVRFMRDRAYRKQCRGQAGACQREIVEHAAKILDDSMKTCRGKLRNALGAYNSGRCSRSAEYAAHVLKERAALRAYARGLANSPERLARLRDRVSSSKLQGAVAFNELRDARKTFVSATQ